nr:hypothetical protein CKG001_10460 [Bdellovibrio sp. CKG001]
MKTPTRDPELLALFRSLPCMACGKPPPSEVHHVKTVGSGGGDDPWNLLPLCVECHKTGRVAWHSVKGPREFLLTYPHVYDYLRKQGWELLNGGLFHPNHADEIGILRQKVYRKRTKNVGRRK